MKISKKEVNLLLMVLGILIAFFAYQFGYNKFNKDTERLEAKNRTMENEISQLEALVTNKDTYVEKTELMNEEINSIIEKFPVGMLEEDMIKFAYQKENTDTSRYMFIEAMAFVGDEIVYTTDNTSVNADNVTVNGILLTDIDINGGKNYPAYTLNCMQTNYGITSSYDGLKDLINNILGNDGRKAINTLNVTYSENTGLLQGSVKVDSYYVTGTDTPYEEPELTKVKTGTDNIFGTVDSYLGGLSGQEE